MKKGFTLLELITVIMIIGIIFALGVMFYLNYVNDSRKSIAVSAVGVIYNAEKIYKEKYGSYLKSEDISDKFELFTRLGINPQKYFIDNWDIEIQYLDSNGDYLYIICRSNKWDNIDFRYNSKEGEFEDI